MEFNENEFAIKFVMTKIKCIQIQTLCTFIETSKNNKNNYVFFLQSIQNVVGFIQSGNDQLDNNVKE